ncbi:MAG: orotidine-5'-phosphate decarboxylase [Candidatus Planktophila sp.]|nr:orotidine-5'-phosphate decarboxylase [Candidatus Planktophila sp.]
METKAPIVLALDTPYLETAIEWIEATQGVVSVYKLGLEFYLTFGRDGVKRVLDHTDSDIFLDLKLHDIPHTVGAAALALSTLQPKYLTVHASGGRSMIAAAVEATPSTHVTGVTILTSLSEKDVQEIGFKENACESAVKLASIAVGAGARAIVCSPLEITNIRAAIGNGVTIITPGVRPTNAAISDDQVRTLTPRQAIERGANLLVIGRPITSQWVNGPTAMRERAVEIAQQIL